MEKNNLDESMFSYSSKMSTSCLGTEGTNENEIQNIKTYIFSTDMSNTILDFEQNLMDDCSLSSNSTFSEKKYKRNRQREIEFQKNKVFAMLKSENVIVGYSSETERYLEYLISQDKDIVKNIFQIIIHNEFDNPIILQKAIEVFSNLNDEDLNPSFSLVLIATINHKNINVQEASIAAFEKWDNKSNITLLKNINYTTPWIKDYADSVVEYLESL